MKVSELMVYDLGTMGEYLGIPKTYDDKEGRV